MAKETKFDIVLTYKGKTYKGTIERYTHRQAAFVLALKNGFGRYFKKALDDGSMKYTYKAK